LQLALLADQTEFRQGLFLLQALAAQAFLTQLNWPINSPSRLVARAPSNSSRKR
jgi:hypothetical protein